MEGGAAPTGRTNNIRRDAHFSCANANVGTAIAPTVKFPLHANHSAITFALALAGINGFRACRCLNDSGNDSGLLRYCRLR